jgi:hypothetical protein
VGWKCGFVSCEILEMKNLTKILEMFAKERKHNINTPFGHKGCEILKIP